MVRPDSHLRLPTLLHLVPGTHLAVERARSRRNPLQVRLVDLEDALNTIDSYVHGGENGYHAHHGDPDAHEALSFGPPFPVVAAIGHIDAEDPRIADSVNHEEYNTCCCGFG